MSIAAPIDMETFQDAIYTWFINATDLFTIWQEQSGPQPEYPYGSLQIISGPSLAAPQHEILDEIIQGQPAGQEIKLTARNQCTFDISCQTYVGKPESRDPNANAMWYINKAQSSLSLPSVQDLLYRSNVAYVRVSEVQNINELIADAYVSRANIDVTFGASLSIEEYTGYINQVELKSNSLGIDTIVGG